MSQSTASRRAISDEPEPLPPPPVPRRLARGSAPWGVEIDLMLPLRVREIVPSRAWSRVIPLSSRGRPVLERDRRPDDVPAADWMATLAVASLATLAATFAALLL